MPIEIFPLSEQEIDAVARLARVVWQDTYPSIISQEQIDYMLGERYAAQRLRDELQTAGIWWDLASVSNGEGRQLAGFAASYLTDVPGEMKLDKLYVDPSRQRSGVGGALIATVAERAREQGCKTLILAVNKNNSRAIAAYRKNGFAIRESVRVDIGRGFVMDDYIMALPL